MLATSLPLLLGATVLVPRRVGNRAAEGISRVLADSGGRLALLLGAALLLLATYVLSPFAAVQILIGAGAVMLAVGGWLRPDLARGLLIGGVAVATSTALALGAAEEVLELPGITRRIGGPLEQKAWDQRYDNLWQRNVFRFRSPHETMARPAHGGRAIALGDSFTWGDRVRRSDSTWPALLEDELRKVSGDTAFEVVNMGQRGYTTQNEAETLRRIGWQFSPDLVIVQFLANDALPSAPNFGREGEEWLWPTRHLLPSSWETGRAGSSELLWLADVALSRALDTVPPSDFSSLYRDDFLGWQQVRRSFEEMGDSARRRGVPVVLMIFPEFVPGVWTAESHPHRAIHDRVRAAAESAGLHVLDLTPVFAAQGGNWSRWWATPYDGHPSVAAHLIASRALAAYLRANQLMRVPAIPARPSEQLVPGAPAN